MAILFVGSTPQDLGGVTVPNTTTAGRDADYTPVGSMLSGDMDETGAIFVVSHEAPASNITWYHFIFNTTQQVYYNRYADGFWFVIRSGTDTIAYVNITDSNYTLEGGGVSSNIFTPFTENTDITYDIKVECDGTDVTVSIYQNGTLAESITYASTLTASTSISMEHNDMVWNTGSHDYFYSEFIVTDNEPTIGWRLATLLPNVNGNYTAWDGDAADLLVYDDGLSMRSTTAGEQQSWTLSAYSGAATSTGVRAVINKYLSSIGEGAGPGTITPFVRNSGTDADLAAFTPDGGSYQQVMDTDPTTSAEWDTADLGAIEFGVKSSA